MSELLTPQEALQALQNGQKVECLLENLETWHNVLLFSTGVLANANNKFRLAPEMITIEGVSFPKPESEPLEIGQEYFVCDIVSKWFYDIFEWENRKLDQDFLKYGMIHLTKEDAITHAKTLIKLSGGTIDE